MNQLHRAALTRAYRTLAQGLGGAATATAFTAIIAAFLDSEANPFQSAIIALGATLVASVVAAFVSFWQGVAGGLPEVPLDPPRRPSDPLHYT